MDYDIEARIQDAAHEAFVEVWDQFVASEAAHSGAVHGATAVVDDRAHAASHEAIRATCAEFGVDPRDYYRADPGAASSCEPDCLEKWPEISVASAHRDSLMEYLERDTERILTDLAETNRVGEYQRVDSDDLKDLYERCDALDEEPPADDLNSEMRSGY